MSGVEQITNHTTRNPRTWLADRPALLFVLWSCCIALVFFAMGPCSYLRVHDQGDANLPARIALDGAYAKSDIGYWDPMRLCGVDRLSLESPIQMDSLPFYIFPDWVAYGFVLWLMRFIAGYFTFLLLRDRLGQDFWPSVYAGLLYSLFNQPTLNGFFDGFPLSTGLSMPGLPLFLWLISRLNEGRWWSRLLSFALGVCFAWSGSYALGVFLFPVFVFWFLCIERRSSAKFWSMAGLFAAGWLVGNGPSFWAAFLNGPLSHRAAWGRSAGQSTDWVTAAQGGLIFAANMIRDNVVPLALGCAGLVVGYSRDMRLVWVMVAAGLCLGFQPLNGLVKHLGKDLLGFLSGMNLAYVHLMVPFLAAVAGGLGLGQVVARLSGNPFPQQDEPVKSTIWAGRLIVAAIALVVFQASLAQGRMIYDMLTCSNFGGCLRNEHLKRLARETSEAPPFRLVTVAQLTRPFQHPGFAWAYGFQTADGYVNLYPQRYKEYWTRVIGPLLKNDRQSLFGYGSLAEYFREWGHRVYLYSPHYADYSVQWTSAELRRRDTLRFADYYSLELLSVANVKYVASLFRFQDPNLVLANPDVLTDLRVERSSRLLKLIPGAICEWCQGPALYIYENTAVFPRSYPLTSCRVFTQHKELLDALSAASLDELRTTAFLLEEDVRSIPLHKLEPAIGSIAVEKIRSDHIILRSDTVSPSIVVIANSFSPYWKARVDGRETRVFPVQHAFQGVFLEGGTQILELRYEPPYALRF